MPYASPPVCSLTTAVCQPLATDGFTHASTVIPVVRSRVAESGTVTSDVVPLKDRAPLNLPPVTCVAFAAVPLFALPDGSPTVVPVVSSKAQAPTSPGEPVFDTVTGTLVDVAVFPAPSRATAVSVCGPFPAVNVSHEIV